MDIIQIIRWAQVGGLSLAALMSLIFLILYSRSWALSNHYARFIITLNVTFIISVILVATGRIMRFLVIIELAKAVVFSSLAIIMASQIYLLWSSNNGKGKDTYQGEPRVPQTKRRG